MSSGVTIRDIRPEEHAGLAALTVAVYQDLLVDDMDDEYVAELTDIAARAGIAAVLVAVDADGRVLGGITYVPAAGPLASFADPDEAVLRFLAVATEAQGRGVGAALVAACVTRARSSGKARVSLHTTRPMTSAQRLYERMGFRRDPERDQTLESGLLLLAYQLDLGR